MWQKPILFSLFWLWPCWGTVPMVRSFLLCTKQGWKTKYLRVFYTHLSEAPHQHPLLRLLSYRPAVINILPDIDPLSRVVVPHWPCRMPTNCSFLSRGEWCQPHSLSSLHPLSLSLGSFHAYSGWWAHCGSFGDTLFHALTGRHVLEPWVHSCARSEGPALHPGQSLVITLSVWTNRGNTHISRVV